jgi:hypothetical protein
LGLLEAFFALVIVFIVTLVVFIGTLPSSNSLVVLIRIIIAIGIIIIIASRLFVIGSFIILVEEPVSSPLALGFLDQRRVGHLLYFKHSGVIPFLLVAGLMLLMMLRVGAASAAVSAEERGRVFTVGLLNGVACHRVHNEFELVRAHLVQPLPFLLELWV